MEKGMIKRIKIPLNALYMGSLWVLTNYPFTNKIKNNKILILNSIGISHRNQWWRKLLNGFYRLGLPDYKKGRYRR